MSKLTPLLIIPVVIFLLGIVCIPHANAETIFSSDFGDGTFSGTTAAPENLGGQNGWEGQGNWDIIDGNAVLNGSFQRARLPSGFTAAVGDSVIINLEDFSTTGDGTNYSFGFASSPEHTGAQMPQVRASSTLSGTTLTFGGASDPNYDAGDLLDVQLSFLRTSGGWSVSSTITNTTDGMMYSGSATPDNLTGNTGANVGLTVTEYLDADPGNVAFFGMRGIGNAGSSNLTLGGVSLETVTAVPEPNAIAMLAFSGIAIAFRRRR